KKGHPAWMEELKDQDEVVHGSEEEALGQIGKEAKEAVPALIATLKDQDAEVRRYAAEALGKIATALFDSRSTEMLPQLKTAYEAMRDHPDSNVKENAAAVKRTIDYFESLWWVEARNRTFKTITDHPVISIIVAAYLL